MVHPRKQIRDAVKNVLLNAATAAGSGVYSNRVLKYFTTELPSLNVVSDSESSDRRTESPRELSRVLDLKIEIRIRESSTLEDELDSLAEEVEQALGAEFWVNDPSFGLPELIENFQLQRTDFDISIEGDEQIALMTLSYGVWYVTETPLAAVSITDDLEEVHVDYNLYPPDQDIDAQDIIDDLQS